MMLTFSDGDHDFVLRDTMVDVDDEGTLEEEEKLEEKEDHAAEISLLEQEGTFFCRQVCMARILSTYDNITQRRSFSHVMH